MNLHSQSGHQSPGRIETHLYLVSPHATPNITPALDSAIRPRKVILLVNPETLSEARWLKRVLKGYNIDAAEWHIDSAWDLQHIRSRIMALLRENAGKPMALNVSCGTKPMAIASYAVFLENDLPVFYIAPDEDELIWVNPAEGGKHALQDRIKLPQFVQAYGGIVSGDLKRSVPQELLPFSESLIQNLQDYEKSIGSLNYFASSAQRDLHSRQMDERSLGSAAFRELLQQLESLRLLHIEDKRMVFADEDARFFVNGGWLEHYVFSQVSELKKSIPEIQDIVMGLEVERGDNVKNEIDVALLADNRLHLVECKAKRFKGGRRDDGTETLYKIDSVSGILGGIQTRSMLVSYSKLSSHDLKRAAELQVTVVQYLQLHHLRDELESWITGRSRF